VAPTTTSSTTPDAANSTSPSTPAPAPAAPSSGAGAIRQLRQNIQKVFLGNPAAIDLLLIGLLARGHVLIEDVPGVGKTVLAKSLARSIDCKFSRVQLTPDLLPGDVLGVAVFNNQAQTFDFKPGPIFANIVLADEINRTTPRTQSALLEAMSEEQVSVENETRPLERRSWSSPRRTPSSSRAPITSRKTSSTASSSASPSATPTGSPSIAS